MSTAAPRLSSSIGMSHPAVLDRRLRSACLVGVLGLIPLVVTLSITLTKPNVSLPLFVLAFVGAIAVLALMLSDRLEITVAIVALYLGLLDGPIKLGVGGGGGPEGYSAVRNVVIGAVALGAVLRLVGKKERVRLPPLGGWAVAFTVLVLVETFNPKTSGILKAFGGYRQLLQWVPFFFFGYAVIRSKARLRKAFIILGVIALANGVVATYQTQIGTSALASWGAGYKLKVEGLEEVLSNGVVVHHGARRFGAEGNEGGIRPMGLGSDAGFGAGVGLIALPCIMALIATSKGRRRWIGVLLCLGALAGVATGLGRLQLVGAVVSVLAFVLLAGAAHRIKPVLATVLGIAILAIPLGAVFVTATGSGMFSRYEKILEANPTGKCGDCKKEALGYIPHEIAVAPFGLGLGTAGPAASFGGTTSELLEGHGVTSETQYNFVTNELGAPGLVLWVAFSIMAIVFAVRRIPRVRDTDLRIYLAAVCAPLIAIAFIGFSGPTSASAALGPWFWFAPGIAAYWLARSNEVSTLRSLARVPAAR